MYAVCCSTFDGQFCHWKLIGQVRQTLPTFWASGSWPNCWVVSSCLPTCRRSRCQRSTIQHKLVPVVETFTTTTLNISQQLLDGFTRRLVTIVQSRVFQKLLNSFPTQSQNQFHVAKPDSRCWLLYSGTLRTKKLFYHVQLSSTLVVGDCLLNQLFTLALCQDGPLTFIPQKEGELRHPKTFSHKSRSKFLSLCGFLKSKWRSLAHQMSWFQEFI